MHAQCTLVLSIFLHGQSLAVVKNIYMLGLFPMEGSWYGGNAVKAAAEVAIDYVSYDANILPGYQLHMIDNDTKCNPGLGLKIFGDAICYGPQLIMVLGAACSVVSEHIAGTAHFWNLIQVSYASTSAALSDKDQFPTFFQLLPSETDSNYARIALLKYFKWTKVNMVYQSHQIFITMMEHLEDVMISQGITIMNKHHFHNSPRQAIHQLKENDARIIIGGFYEDKAREVFCEAFKMRFSGPKIVWVIPGFLKDNWWSGNDTDCTDNEILSSIGNYFVVNVLFKSGSEPDDNGITLKQFMNDYKTKTENKTIAGSNFLLSSYDSVWVIARALNATIADLQNTDYGLEHFTYTNTFIKELIKTNMEKVNFTSISGHVAFDEKGAVTRMLKIQQFQGGELVTVGAYDKRNVGNETIWTNFTPVFWKNGVVPGDSIKIVLKPAILLQWLHITMCVLAAFGICLSLGFLAFNIKFRNIRIIKMSSPNINNIILAGCIIAYLFVFVKGIHIKEVPANCQIRGFFLVIAVSLVFGALFAKTWRVYVIFTKPRRIPKRTYQDTDLYIHIGVVTGINVGLMIMWAIISPSYPMEIKLDHLKVEDPVNDRVVIPVVWNCRSKYDVYFEFSIIALQGIMLLFGIFLAFTTRKVTIPVLNDSKAIGMCLYNIFVLASVGFPVWMLLEDNFNVTFGLVCSLIIVGTTVTQCLIFVPKVYALMEYLKGDQSECRIMSLSKQASPSVVDNSEYYSNSTPKFTNSVT